MQPQNAEHTAAASRPGLRQVWDGMLRARTAGLAAEVAFFAFTSLIPLAVVLGMLAAKLAAHDTATLRAILDATPPAMRDLLEEELRKMSAWNGGAVAPMAAVVFVGLASTGLHAIFDALEVQTGSSRPWWRKRLYAIGVCLGSSVAVAAITLLLAGLGGLAVRAEAAWGFTLASAKSPVWSVLRALFAGLFSVAIVAGLYWVGVPPSARKRMPILPGALVATSGHWALGYGYSAVLVLLGGGGAYLAGLAAVGVTLTSLYLSALVLLVGVEINEVLGARRLDGSVREPRGSRVARTPTERIESGGGASEDRPASPGRA